LRQPSSAPVEIVKSDPAENAPTSADRTFERASDLRLSDARIIAYRDLRDAKTVDGSFQEQLDGPAVGFLLQISCPEYFRARRAKGAKVGDFEAIESIDQGCGEAIAKDGMPWKSTGGTRGRYARTQANVGAPLDDRSKKKRKFGGTIAVIAIQKN